MHLDFYGDSTFRQYQNIVDKKIIQRIGYLDQGVESDWTEIKLNCIHSP